MKNKKLAFTVSTTVDREKFLEVFMKNLIEAKNKNAVLWESDADILSVFRQFVQTLEDGTYSRHCLPIQWTCRELKLKNTRETIDAIFKTNNKGEIK